MNDAPCRLALAVVCVLMVSGGQLLFRQTGLAIERCGDWMATEVLALLGTALATYALATLLWIHVLRTIPLAVAYPIMGLSFVLVPLLDMQIFRAPLSIAQGVGALLVLAGIAISQVQF